MTLAANHRSRLYRRSHHVESIYKQPEAENFVRMGRTSLVQATAVRLPPTSTSSLEKSRSSPQRQSRYAVAHGSVRSKVMGLNNRAPTPEELQKMEALVEQGMKDGSGRPLDGRDLRAGRLRQDRRDSCARSRPSRATTGLRNAHAKRRHRGCEAIRESIQIGEQARLPVEFALQGFGAKALGQKGCNARPVREARQRGINVTVTICITALSPLARPTPSDWLLDGGVRKVKSVSRTKRQESVSYAP